MIINLTKEQLKLIFEYDNTKSITSACDLAESITKQVLLNLSKDME